jgi:subtilase family serine protease
MLPGKRLTRPRSRRALLASLIVMATGIGTLALAAPSLAAPAPPAGKPAVRASSAAPALPAGAVRAGTLPASRQLTIEVTLNLRDQAGLTTLLNGLADRTSPYFHDFLTSAQFDAAFGPTAQQVSDVDTALLAAGLTPGHATAGNLAIPVTATATALEHAFGITLADYRLPGGRVAYANTAAPRISSSLTAIVGGIIGLDDLSQAQPLSAPRAASADPTVARSLGRDAASLPAAVRAAGPQPCAAATNAWPLTYDQFADFYGLTQLYSLGDLGAGQKVAILELEPNENSDINSFKKCYGISKDGEVNYIKVDGGAGTGTGSGEAALDIETVAALAPKATIDVYQAPNTGDGPGEGLYDILAKFASANTEKTMSVSWGSCELNDSTANLNALEIVAAEAYAHGQTILSASGDNGSTGCSSASDSDSRLSVITPSSLPFVTSVGGTSINATGTGDEVFQNVWNESDLVEGAGGGGVSTVFCMPDYQYQPSITGLISSDSKTKSTCATKKDTKGYVRQTPDVSANADPNFGYGIFVGDGWEGGIGGTSAATPLWAAIAALTNASPYCAGYGSGTPGVLGGALYAAVAKHVSAVFKTNSTIMDDIVAVSGFDNDNDYTPSGYTGGLYPETDGYDMASGIGTPSIWSTTPSGTTFTYPVMMCQQLATRSTKVTSVSPGSGKANATAKVTIKGSGFIAVSGADKVRVYSGSKVLATLTASCSATACTVTLPKESARTVDLRVSVLSGSYTGAVAADHYTYANAPHISSASPAKGTHNGGTKVTIKGSNFIGVKSVTFNGKAGTKLAVSGTGTITVVTPKGTKGAKVKVVVNAAGGASNSVTYQFT